MAGATRSSTIIIVRGAKREEKARNGGDATHLGRDRDERLERARRRQADGGRKRLRHGGGIALLVVARELRRSRLADVLLVVPGATDGRAASGSVRSTERGAARARATRRNATRRARHSGARRAASRARERGVGRGGGGGRGGEGRSEPAARDAPSIDRIPFHSIPAHHITQLDLNREEALLDSSRTTTNWSRHAARRRTGSASGRPERGRRTRPAAARARVGEGAEGEGEGGRREGGAGGRRRARAARCQSAPSESEEDGGARRNARRGTDRPTPQPRRRTPDHLGLRSAASTHQQPDQTRVSSRGGGARLQAIDAVRDRVLRLRREPAADDDDEVALTRARDAALGCFGAGRRRRRRRRRRR